MANRPVSKRFYNVRVTTRRIRTGPYMRHPDAELVLLAVKGEQAAYEELVERYQVAARYKAHGIVKDFQAAEDVTQDALVKAYNSLKELESPQKFGAWLQTIVQHTALDLVRARRENMSLETMKDQGYEAPRDTRGLQIEKLEDREEELKVLDAMSDLREDYREILILKHVEKLSYKEIAERLHMTVSAVGEKLSRVRKLLDRRLHKQQVNPKDGTGEEE